MFSWIFGNSSSVDSNTNMEKYKTLFFAGFSEPSSTSTSTVSTSTATTASATNKPAALNLASAVLEQAIIEKAKKTSLQQNAEEEKEEEENSSLESLVYELFSPYGDIEFFFFDSNLGAGIVEYKNGKSGESCYLMSNLLPFRIFDEEQTKSKSKSKSNKKKNSKQTRTFFKDDEKKKNDNDDDNRESSIAHDTNAVEDTSRIRQAKISSAEKEENSFSLVCLEFASILPISLDSTSFLNSPYAWVCSRKSLGKEEEELQTSSSSSSDLSHTETKKKEIWRDHLVFLESQQQQKKLYLKNIVRFRRELLIKVSKSNNENENEKNEIESICPEVSAELLSQVENHMKSLLQITSSSKNKSSLNSNKNSFVVNEFVPIKTNTEFWQEVVIPNCFNKIIEQVCQISSEEILSNSNISPPVSPEKQKSRKQSQEQTENSETSENSQDKTTKTKTSSSPSSSLSAQTINLIKSVVHSSLSIVDVWHSIFLSFYLSSSSSSSSQNTKTPKNYINSAFAVLQQKLGAHYFYNNNNNNNNSSNSSSSSASSSSSLRHPAWASYAVTFPTPESKKYADVSAAIERRCEYAKLFQSHIPPIHLGLKEWPGGESDDVGSSFRALFVLLNSVKPFYQDGSFRKMWYETTITTSNNNNKNDKINSSSSSPPEQQQIIFLEKLKNCEHILKKQFSNCSSEHLLDGAWNILFRSSWRMESAFSLIVSYLQEKERNFEQEIFSSSSSSEKTTTTTTTKSNNSGGNEEEESETVMTMKSLKALDAQPSLWLLLRPVDNTEIDFKRSRGVFPDTSRVYSRLFDEDDAQQQEAKRNKNKNTNLTIVEKILLEWKLSVKNFFTTLFILVFNIFGQDGEAIMRSRHYRRKVLGSGFSFFIPIFWMIVLTCVIFYLMKAGYIAPVQEGLYNLLTTGSFFEVEDDNINANNENNNNIHRIKDSKTF